MSSISYDSALQNSLSGKSKSFIKRYSIASILRKSGAFKLQGFSSILCFFVLFQSVFFQTSLFNSTKITKDPFHAQWTPSIAFSIPLPLTGGALLRYFRYPSSKNLFFI